MCIYMFRLYPFGFFSFFLFSSGPVPVSFDLGRTLGPCIYKHSLKGHQPFEKGKLGLEVQSTQPVPNLRFGLILLKSAICILNPNHINLSL